MSQTAELLLALAGDFLGRRTFLPRAQIKDSRTGKMVKQLRFDKNYPAEDITVSPDINGNGSEDIVMLGKHKTTGELRAVAKDPRTGEHLGFVDF